MPRIAAKPYGSTPSGPSYGWSFGYVGDNWAAGYSYGTPVAGTGGRISLLYAHYDDFRSVYAHGVPPYGSVLSYYPYSVFRAFPYSLYAQCYANPLAFGYAVYPSYALGYGWPYYGSTYTDVYTSGPVYVDDGVVDSGGYASNAAVYGSPYGGGDYGYAPGDVDDAHASRPIGLAEPISPSCIEAEVFIAAGQEAFFGRRYDEASRQFVSAILVGCDDAAVFAQYGLARLALRDYPVAGVAMRRALAADAEGLLTSFDPRRLYVNPAEFDEQLAALEEYATNVPQDPGAAVMAGFLYLSTGEVDRAATLLRAAAADPNDTLAQELLRLAEFQAGASDAP